MMQKQNAEVTDAGAYVRTEVMRIQKWCWADVMLSKMCFQNMLLWNGYF